MRVTPHKARREKKNERDENLRKEVSRLTRQVSSLRKELTKRDRIEEEAIEDEAPENEPEEKAEKCPDCGHETKQMELAGRVFVVCPECKFRKKIK
jgi:formamidopyrimidine-DNA glycosylase